MKYRIEIAATAKADVREAARWIAERASPTAAGRWIAGLYKAMATLESQPGRCPLAAESHKLPVEPKMERTASPSRIETPPWTAWFVAITRGQAMRDSRRRPAAAVLGTVLVSAIVGAAPGPDRPSAPAPNGAPRMETWWADLENEETTAARALLNLADHPKETVAFLKKKLRPLKISSGEVKKLLLRLGSESEAVWKPAFEELEYFDPRLAIDLPTLMDRYKEAPGRQRMVEVLSGHRAGSLKGKEVQLWKFGGADDYNFRTKSGGSWWAEVRVDRIGTPFGGNAKKKWTRAARAIVLLEHIGTPEARDVLRAMATGHPDAYPTRVASEALHAVEENARGAAGRASPTP